MKTFRGIVREALESTMQRGPIDLFDSDDLAVAIELGLRLEGIRLHDAANCIRLGPIEATGRELTPEIVERHAGNIERMKRRPRERREASFSGGR